MAGGIEKTTLLSVEALKHVVFDHNKNISLMSPQEIINEILFLSCGHADEVGRHGVKMGLLPKLRKRLEELQEHVLKALVAEMWV